MAVRARPALTALGDDAGLSVWEYRDLFEPARVVDEDMLVECREFTNALRAGGER